MEIAADAASMASDSGVCCLIEVMGRAAGWIAAGTVLAKRSSGDAPHIILLPEIPFDESGFLAKVQETLAANKYCIVVVGEGLRNAAGKELAADERTLDAFGVEAVACGAAAVRAAIDGQSGLMVKLVRHQNSPYRWTTGFQELKEIANVERLVPREWISADGFLPNETFIEYARPLIDGELHLPMDGGLPKFVTLQKSPVEKKLSPRA